MKELCNNFYDAMTTLSSDLIDDIYNSFEYVKHIKGSTDKSWNDLTIDVVYRSMSFYCANSYNDYRDFLSIIINKIGKKGEAIGEFFITITSNNPSDKLKDIQECLYRKGFSRLLNNVTVNENNTKMVIKCPYCTYNLDIFLNALVNLFT